MWTQAVFIVNPPPPPPLNVFTSARFKPYLSESPTSRFSSPLGQVGFEDVIAEPRSAHSLDRVWIGSHAVFEVAKYVFYRVLTTLLAVPMAFLLGLVFGVIACVHIWYGYVAALYAALCSMRNSVVVVAALGAVPSAPLIRFVATYLFRVLLHTAYLTSATPA